MNANLHKWRFFRAGGFDQVRLDSAADLMNLDQLDQKLWVALSCPTRGLEFDARTLALLDADGDGHIRAPELIAALKWAGSLLLDPELLACGADPLPLAAIDEGNEEGRQLLASARVILASLGRPEATHIGADDTSDQARIFAQTPFNGDGVITAASTGDEALAGLLAEIIERVGGVPDRSGESGIDRDRLEAFFNDARALVAWRAEAAAHAALMPCGADTDAAFQAFAAVREKVEDYFTRCRLAAFDRRAVNALNGSEADFLALGAQQLSAASSEVAALPLAFAEGGRPLPLAGEGRITLNPAWLARLQSFAQRVVAPLLGERQALDEAGWQEIVERFAPYTAWLSARPASVLEAMEPARLETIVFSDAQARLAGLIAQDEGLTREAEAITAVEKLAHYVRDLGRLANNFVSFREFYVGPVHGGEEELTRPRQPAPRAVFQAGTLYLDGRSCQLCVPVLDPARHATLAVLSGVYLAYCDCVREGEKVTIAAAFTAGDSDQLMVGRNGVFYDRQGRDWDATITRIVDHPISLRQAFWSPYRKAARMVSEQLQKFAAAKAKAVDDLAAARLIETGKTASAAAAAGTVAPTAPTPFDVARFAGIFAAIGLAVGALGTALASVVAGFIGLRWWQMPLAVLGVILLISGPSMATALFKLRNRNLGPILDANGWAVNARARINIPFGTSLTQVARLPEGAERSLADPYADRKRPWKFYAALLALAVGALLWATRGAAV